MASSVLLSLLLLTAVFFGHGSCAQFSPSLQDNAEMYVCAHRSLFIPWTLQLDNGDVIEDVQWFYSGTSEEMVAFLVHDTFVPMDSYSGRVHRTTNTGITIVQLTTMDSGNYSVRVIVSTARGDTVTLHRSASVHVSDGLPTTDGHLHVVQRPVAEHDEKTGEDHVVLTCGTFTYTGQPPFDATWMTPSGQTAPSSGYKDGHFFLRLPHPPEPGTYTCHVPPTSTCDDGNTRNASLSLDSTAARLAILESQTRALEGKLSDLDAAAPTPTVGSCHNTQVSFHARFRHHQHLPHSGSPLIFDKIVTNRGQGYNPSSGAFTAPVSGTYCFMASTETYGNGYEASMFLMVDNDDVDYLHTHSIDSSRGPEAGSVHAVVHLTRGQRVWLKSDNDSYYWGRATTFSGFLVSEDV